MTAKEYLRQYEYADRRVQRLEAEYAKEMELIDAVRSTADLDGMPKGNGISKPVEEKAIRLADKAMEIAEARLDAVQVRQDVFSLINGIDGDEGTVLFERYVNLHKWEEICVMLKYSWNGVHKIHRRALTKVEEVLHGV